MTLRARASVEDFLRLPEGKPYREFWRGEVREKMPPSFAHSFLQSELARRLGNWAAERAGGYVVTEQRCVLRARDRQEVLLPDVAWFPHDSFETIPEGAVEVPPRLAVEILSPDDSYARMEERVQFYLEAGVVSVWVVDPRVGSVVAWTPGEPPRVVDDLLSDTALPGLSIPLKDLFGRLGFPR